jgi:hypothetical protein
MSKSEIINNIVSSKKLALAGLSRNPKSFSRMVFKDMKQKGFEVLPINPNSGIIDETYCYKTINDIPEGTENLLIMTAKAHTDEILKTAINKGFKNIWIQQGSETKNSELIASDLKFTNLVTKQCIFMFNNPSGIHKFHKSINKFFGLLPK